MTAPEVDRDKLRLVQLLEAAEEVSRDAAEGKSVFLNDRLTRSTIILGLIHLTESADKLSKGFKRANTQVNWSRLRDLRNEGLVHGYPDADYDDLWRFIHVELPALRRQLSRPKRPK